MRRTLVIGDVHGCAAELDALLLACARQEGDRVVLVGDLLTKGPDPAGVLRTLRATAAEAVCGNHDAHLLRWRANHGSGRVTGTGDDPLGALCRALSPEDWALLEALPPFLRLPEHDAIVVHAGIAPGVPLEQQSPDVLMNVRTIRPDGSPSKRPDDGPLWGSLYPGPELILFGHHARQGLQRHPHAIGLDTGCVYGGALSACVLPARELVSVPAARVYQEPDP